jgi:4-amino-4-deoxy-L-arabinose transferase-like glycosyltransferase
MNTRSLLHCLAVFGTVFALFWDLGAYPLLQPDEGRNAEIAREMLESGSWLIPTYNGLPYLDKPAFFFRTVASSLAILGENEAAARLPSALFGLATIGLIYAFCRRHYDQTVAATAALILATSPLFFAFARVVIFDMTLCFFVSASILACYNASQESGARRKAYYGFGVAMAAFATLVKGPVGFIVPTVVVSIFHVWNGERRWWRDAFSPWNILIFLSIVAPWFAAVSLRHPDFPYYGLVKESFQRFTTNEFRRTAPFYYYAVVIAVCFFPWSLMLPGAILQSWPSRKSWLPVDRLFVTWAATVVAFFSLSQSKLPGYILTAVVALSVLVARIVSSACRKHGSSPRRAIVRQAGLGFALLALLQAALGLWLWFDPTIVTAVGPRAARYLDHMGAALGWLALLFAVTGAVALTAFLRRNPYWTAGAFLGFGLTIVPLLAHYMGVYAEHRSAATLATRMPPLGNDTMVVCCRCYPNGYSFYSKRKVTVISSKDGYELQSNYIRFVLQQQEDWPPTMIRERDFQTWQARTRQPLFMVAKNDDIERCGTLANQSDLKFSRLTADYAGAWLQPAGRD